MMRGVRGGGEETQLVKSFRRGPNSRPGEETLHVHRRVAAGVVVVGVEDSSSEDEYSDDSPVVAVDSCEGSSVVISEDPSVESSDDISEDSSDDFSSSLTSSQSFNFCFNPFRRA